MKLSETEVSQTILLLGGYNEEGNEDNAAVVFKMTFLDKYQLLHYIDVTGVWDLLNTNQCQDLFEL